MYVQKDKDGNIVSYFSEPIEGAEKVKDENDPKIVSFKEKIKNALSSRKSIQDAKDLIINHVTAELLKDDKLPKEIKDACNLVLGNEKSK